MASPQLTSNDPHSDLGAPRERAREARRQAVLQAAESVFAERGFAGATMAEIASRAGYSAGNLYNVCESKEALFQEVVTTRAAQVSERVLKAVEQDAPIAKIVSDYVHTCLDLVEQYRGFFVMLTQATPDFDWHPEGRDRDDDLSKHTDASLARCFERAMSRGEIPAADPRTYVCLLHGTVNAHASRWVREEASIDSLQKPADELIRALQRGFGIEG